MVGLLRDRLRVSRRTIWLGNGFGTETVWTATFDGVQIGEWRSDSMASNWIGELRGMSVASKRDWRAAVDAEALRRVAA